MKINEKFNKYREYIKRKAREAQKNPSWMRGGKPNEKESEKQLVKSATVGAERERD